MICYDIMNMMVMCNVVNFYFIMIYEATSYRLIGVSYTQPRGEMYCNEKN